MASQVVESALVQDQAFRQERNLAALPDEVSERIRETHLTQTRANPSQSQMYDSLKAIRIISS